MSEGLGRRVLAEVGVSADAEDVYQFLLGAPRSTATEILAGRGIPIDRVHVALAELEAKAMVSRHGGSSSPRFEPAPPDMMVEALISTREDALRRTRLDALQLGALQSFAPARTDVGELVELLTSRQASALRWSQLQGSARTSVEGFVRPPFAQPLPDGEPVQTVLQGRDVVTRAIYDEAALGFPGGLEHVARMAAAGEQARVVSELPIKLVIVDRRTAMMPFTPPDPAETMDAGLVVHQSSLLDALIALFDLYWERATEFRADAATALSGEDAAGEDTVLTLMAAGYKDDAIAGQLGVSTATVRRRITALQKRLKVTTRFQAGLALGRARWREDRTGSGPDRPRTTGA